MITTHLLLVAAPPPLPSYPLPSCSIAVNRRSKTDASGHPQTSHAPAPPHNDTSCRYNAGLAHSVLTGRPGSTRGSKKTLATFVSGSTQRASFSFFVLLYIAFLFVSLILATSLRAIRVWCRFSPPRPSWTSGPAIITSTLSTSDLGWHSKVIALRWGPG